MDDLPSAHAIGHVSETALKIDPGLHAVLGVCLEDLIFYEHPGLFGAKLPTTTGTVETDLAIEMYFLTATSWAVHILVFRLSHLASLSLTIRHFSSAPDVLSAFISAHISVIWIGQ